MGRGKRRGKKGGGEPEEGEPEEGAPEDGDEEAAVEAEAPTAPVAPAPRRCDFEMGIQGDVQYFRFGGCFRDFIGCFFGSSGLSI